MGEQLAVSTTYELDSNCFSLKSLFTELYKLSHYRD